MKEFKLSITHIKILETIDTLNKKSYYPLAEGVYKIIAGIMDEETLPFINEPTFGTLISFSSKKTCRYILALQRHGYIKKIYDQKSDNLYLVSTMLGSDAVIEFHKKHKKPFDKKKKQVKQTIVKM